MADAAAKMKDAAAALAARVDRKRRMGASSVKAKEKAVWEKAADSSAAVEAREEEGHMATELKGLTQAMSLLAKSKFPQTPLPPSEPSRKEWNSRKKGGEERAHRVIPRGPPWEAQEMLYVRTPLTQSEWKKKKNAQVEVQPSTPAQDAAASKEKQTQVVIQQPSTPDFLDDKIAAYWARREKEKETEPEESRTDNNAYEAILYHKYWNDSYAAEERASYEDTTSIPPMCFTDSPCTLISTQPTLQIFSVKIEEVTGGLDWPLDVYGVVAVRDVVDHKRNIIFYRERDNCQTINSKDPYLALTGPTRAVVVSVHPTYFEVDLKVKGAVESEDKDLSLLAVCYSSNGPSRSCVLTRVAASKLSTLKFTFGHILYSVEATVSIEILGGEWPKVYHKGIITASTESLKGRDIALLSFGDGKLPVEDGKVKLSRRVVSVELVPLEEEKLRAKLMVCLKAVHASDKNGKVEQHLSFKPKSRGRSYRTIKVDSCEMQVTVAWSLLSSFRCSYEKVMSAGVA